MPLTVIGGLGVVNSWDEDRRIMSEQLYDEITKEEQRQDFLEKRGIRFAHRLRNKEGEGRYSEHTLTL